MVAEHNLSADPESFETPDEQTEDLEALTFDDLLSFAFQVARGMEFLSSKNVGDKHLPPSLSAETHLVFFVPLC